MATEKVSVTVKLEQDTVAFLDKLAQVEERDRTYMIRRAVANFVELRRWQIEDIEKALKEADAGLFATDEEVEKWFGKWTA